MRVPGRDALFSSLKIGTVRGESSRSSDFAGAQPSWTAKLCTTDTRTGTVVIDALCTGTGNPLNVRMLACQHARVPAPSYAPATSLLPASDRLAGSDVLVIGGSRGVGAVLVMSSSAVEDLPERWLPYAVTVHCAR